MTTAISSVETRQGRGVPTPARVEMILSRLDQLPSPPAVAMRLLNVTTSDDSSVRDVVRIVKADTSLTAAVLRMARRADLGIREDIVTVDRAVALLGFTSLRNIALSVQFLSTIEPDEDERGRLGVRRDIWLHSLAVACAAELLAKHAAKKKTHGEAFVCGLLHDIGKIALDTCLPKSYARIVNATERQHRCICDAEKELFGIDHTMAGRRLLTRWQLPASIVECGWLHHHDPDSLPSSTKHIDLLRLVHIADGLVRRQRIGFSGYAHAVDLEAHAAAAGIPCTAIDKVAKELPSRLAPFSEMIGWDEDISQTLYAESIIKANRELGRLNTTLEEKNRALGTRSLCFRALQRFTGGLSPRTGTAEVCASAATSIGELADTGRVVVFVGSSSPQCFHVGVRKEAGEASIDMIDLGYGQTQEVLQFLREGAGGGGIVEAPPALDSIWSRCIAVPAVEPLWFLPLGDGEGSRGGVVFEASQPVVTRLAAARDDCRSFATTIGMALATSEARERSERTTEELLDINRRLEVAQKELIRARSVAMVGEMAAGAAHEINNPLSVISGRAQLALQQCDDEQMAGWLKLIIEHAHGASQIVMDLMNFAKPPPPNPIEQRLVTVLDSLCQRWYEGSSLRQDQVEMRVADAECTICADSVQLDSILDAVVANAIEACSPESLRLQINSPSMVSDETVRIVIEDHGSGMSREVQEHAFDPFFSSRPAGRGRGLGLSKAFRFAEINGGHLWLDSTPNVGTIVSIELPARAPAN